MLINIGYKLRKFNISIKIGYDFRGLIMASREGAIPTALRKVFEIFENSTIPLTRANFTRSESISRIRFRSNLI